MTDEVEANQLEKESSMHEDLVSRDYLVSRDALDAFVKIFWTSLVPNVVTFVSILPACAGLKDLSLGKAIHGQSICQTQPFWEHPCTRIIN